MALLPVLSLISVAKDATYLVLQDNTGNYSSANTGGFGTPNPLQADVSSIILSATWFDNLNTTYNQRLADRAILTSAVNVPLIGFGGLAAGTVYPDGVYDLKYNLQFALGAVITFAPNSTAFTMTGADTVFADGVGFVANNTNVIYHIDRSRPLTSTGGYVLEPLLGNGSFTVLEKVYEGDLKILVNITGANCLTADIGIWAEDGCRDNDFRDILTRFKQTVALKARFAKCYYYDSHKLARSLASYCTTSSTHGTCCC